MIANPTNLVSSWFFFISAWHACIRGLPEATWACYAIIVCSFFYHTTHNKYIRIIDMIVCHFTVVYFGYILMTNHLYYYMAFIVLVLTFMTFWVYELSKSDNGIIWHILVHILCTIMIILAVEACHLNECSGIIKEVLIKEPELTWLFW
jgi:hypothetical protein